MILVKVNRWGRVDGGHADHQQVEDEDKSSWQRRTSRGGMYGVKSL